MRNIDSCYFCFTPFHIISAISIVKQCGETADLYIVNRFAGAKECAERIKKEGLFSEVKVLEFYSCKSKNKMAIWGWTFLGYMRINKISKETLIEDTQYKRICSATTYVVFKWVYIYLVRENPTIKRMTFDDGTASYINDDYLTLFTKRDYFLLRILFKGKLPLLSSYCQMLYSPKLYYLIHGEPNRKIIQIQHSFVDKETIETFNRIFDYKSTDTINDEVVILDCLKDQIFDLANKNKLLDIYQVIFESFCLQNVIVKCHPRDTEDKKQGVKYYSNNQIPIECVFMNIDCNKKVLISASSTAVVTPKLMFGQEPYVVLLYKLLEFKNTNVEDMDCLYQNFKQLYREPNRFMIPQSINELTECIKLVKSSVGDK